MEKVFWWTLRDGGTRQFDMADMVGLMRANLSPKYSYYAFAWMTRMLEGRSPLSAVSYQLSATDVAAAVLLPLKRLGAGV